MFVLGDGNPLVHIRAPYVNRSIIAACAAIFIAQAAGSVPIVDYGFVPAGVTGVPAEQVAWNDIKNTPMRLVSHQFMHANSPHLLGNMLMLWVFGDNIEDAVGHVRYALFYLLCGVIAALTFGVIVADPWVPLVGASGSISGVMGAYLLLHPRARVLVAAFSKVPLVLPGGLVVGFYLVLNLAMAFGGATSAGDLQVAWWAHIGGFVAGMVLILFMRQSDVALFQPLSAYPVDPFPRLRTFAGKFGLGGLFAGGHKDSPDNDWLAAGLRAVGFVVIGLLLLGMIA